jgi:hypothetical protein
MVRAKSRKKADVRERKSKMPRSSGGQPWDARPVAPVGSTSAEEIYLEVGFALSQWEFADIQLSDLYLSLIGAYYGSSRSIALRAYGAASAFSTRSGMIEAGGKAFFKKRRKPLRDRAINARVVEFEKRVADDFEPLMREIVDLMAYRYVASDIQHYRQGFEALTQRILKYTERILEIGIHDDARDDEQAKMKGRRPS